MGYVLPYMPIETIQYQNRIPFDRWPSVSAVTKIYADKNLSMKSEQKNQVFAAMSGKGNAIDLRI